MIEIDEHSLPFVRTGQALLVLDLQNDFIDSGAVLPVRSPPDLIANIVKLLPEFRACGPIISIRSIFETSRPFNEPQGDSESVVTDNELAPNARVLGLKSRTTLLKKLMEQTGKMPQSSNTDFSTTTLVVDDGPEQEDNDDEEEEEDDDDDLEGEDDSLPETFLTVAPGQRQKLVLPASPGTNFAESIVAAADIKKDLFSQKTYYSAFKDGSLVQTLRAKFVTEIYICGALTNISVFATAMDAARHGYAITIVEDCVGYRSKARHDEALRRLQEFAGCELITSTELIGSLREKLRMQRATARHPRPQRPREKNAAPVGIENLMASLSLRSAGIPGSTSKSNSTGPSQSVAGAENAGAALIVDDAVESPDIELLMKTDIGKKRERVQSKVKSRRRPSKSVPKDTTVPGDSKKAPPNPATANLSTGPQALEKLPASSEVEKKQAPGGIRTSEHRQDKPGPSRLVVDPEFKPTENGGIAKEPKAAEPLSASKAEMETASTNDGLFDLCEGDTSIFHNLLEDELEKGIFERLRDEVRWQKMSHQGGDVPRLVVVQGEVGQDGSIPIYRHPADESPPLLPFSPTVLLIRAQVEKKLGHPVNHVLIQFYRDGTDYISEHSDKTLDIVPNTFIANVSLGAQRTMVFRAKKAHKTDETVNTAPAKPREAVRVPLPHNSMCRMGLVTNMRWLHSIRQDKRPIQEKLPEELAYGCGRISLTFRLIGTFLDKHQQKIWGQGAVSKMKERARTVVNGKTEEAERMVNAFGTENHSSVFDWKATYGEGFDVLHMSSSSKLFLSGDSIADLRVKLTLAEYGIAWTEGKVSPSFNWKSGSSAKDAPEIPEVFPVKFIDSDLSKSTVVGDLAILLYLDAVYGPMTNKKAKSPSELAKQYTLMHQSGDLLKLWKSEPFSVKPFRRELDMWEGFAKQESAFIAGSSISLADFALFPVLLAIQKEWDDWTGVDNLVDYCSKLRQRDCTVKVLGPT
ncbi:Isochorismatase hydrolase [Hyaloscypha variabilis F]|uniref:Isochorismatase hydrolase n=1 Tax=Hyaloscypha variabilis (strain UAMH 11265 / GT02V1 / F) TaxID=1149755 RepID=A0A2J6S376_HYAVF|nr:Isochorismatase hydrolase [Hyaloscypha variabilis F]